uniref:Macaca fascicularis brain cDNA clone: QbsB-10307, similar to human hypothetical protein MGC33424 (MGC33424), mRNA, RefSeq: NM_153705.2 n=1 Tax=Macaca fascicularis TaxID=9541 RepID=I7G4S1_MACFA|nr:unnamed protein product [Macaca fascicularis]
MWFGGNQWNHSGVNGMPELISRDPPGPYSRISLWWVALCGARPICSTIRRWSPLAHPTILLQLHPHPPPQPCSFLSSLFPSSPPSR